MDHGIEKLDSRIVELDYRLERAGSVFRPRGFISAWRRFGSTLVTQIRGGGYILETDSERYAVREGEGFLIPSGMRTRVSVPPGHESTTVCQHFHCLAYGSLDLFALLDHPLLLGADTARRVGEINTRLREVQDASRRSLAAAGEVLELGGQLVRLLLADFPELEAAWRDSGRQRLLPVLRFLQENLEKPIRREDLASVVALSVPRFHVVFTEAFGVPPMDYVREQRLSRARQLLLRTELPVAEVAWKCGFDDPYYFSRAFRRGEGLPPTAYRRDMRHHGV